MESSDFPWREKDGTYRNARYTVTPHLESRADDEWSYTVRDRELNLAIVVQVSAWEAKRSKSASWWAERGNVGMARYEAERWAASRARDLGASLIQSASRAPRAADRPFGSERV
jgi:hypothetical protein